MNSVTFSAIKPWLAFSEWIENMRIRLWDDKSEPLSPNGENVDVSLDTDSDATENAGEPDPTAKEPTPEPSQPKTIAFPTTIESGDVPGKILIIPAKFPLNERKWNILSMGLTLHLKNDVNFPLTITLTCKAFKGKTLDKQVVTVDPVSTDPDLLHMPIQQPGDFNFSDIEELELDFSEWKKEFDPSEGGIWVLIENVDQTP